MSLGRYGADDPSSRKVPLHVTVDRWVSDRLGKVRKQKSVSRFVNDMLGSVIRLFDPGPLSPMIQEIVALLERYKREAEALGDQEKLAWIEGVHSQLELFIDLSEAEPRQPPDSKEGGGGVAASGTRASADVETALKPRTDSVPKHDYWWYAVPIICHGTPMVYMKALKEWKCTVCGKVLRDT